VVEAHGGRIEPLLDGSVVATMTGGGSATDQAARAARCALAMRAVAPALRMALATGRGIVAGRLPAGEAIDRAARLVRVPHSGGRAPVRIDDVTAGLLGGSFELGGDPAGLELRGEAEHETVRKLLGKPTPC